LGSFVASQSGVAEEARTRGFAAPALAGCAFIVGMCLDNETLRAGTPVVKRIWRYPRRGRLNKSPRPGAWVYRGLLTLNQTVPGAYGSAFDISADGRRELVLLGPAAQMTTRLVAVTNWFGEVERLAQPRAR